MRIIFGMRQLESRLHCHKIYMKMSATTYIIMPINIPTQEEIYTAFKQAFLEIPNSNEITDRKIYDKYFRSVGEPNWTNLVEGVWSLRVDSRCVLFRVATYFFLQNDRGAQLIDAKHQFATIANRIRSLVTGNESVSLIFSPIISKAVPYGAELELKVECMIQMTD